MDLIIFRENKCLSKGTYNFPPGSVQKLNWSPWLQFHNIWSLFTQLTKILFKTARIFCNSPLHSPSFHCFKFPQCSPSLLAWTATSKIWFLLLSLPRALTIVWSDNSISSFQYLPSFTNLCSLLELFQWFTAWQFYPRSCLFDGLDYTTVAPTTYFYNSTTKANTTKPN